MSAATTTQRRQRVFSVYCDTAPPPQTKTATTSTEDPSIKPNKTYAMFIPMQMRLPPWNAVNLNDDGLTNFSSPSMFVSRKRSGRNSAASSPQILVCRPLESTAPTKPGVATAPRRRCVGNVGGVGE